MGDARALRAKLAATDITAPTIQSSASAMMRFYESPVIAVTEWRNVLQSCQTSQLLPLLYVANEVLQTSKRNRGNKFLEAFGPVLGGSLRFICEKDPSSTEKVRRTAKIWGDRRVFSLRFVGDILSGLESYRSHSSSTAGGGRGSQLVSKTQAQTPETTNIDSSTNNDDKVKNQTVAVSAPQATPTESDNSDDDLFGDAGVDGDEDNDDDDGDAFENSNQPSLLHVSNFSDAVQKGAESKRPASQKQAFGSKRRRTLEQKSGITSRKRMKSMMNVSTTRKNKKRSQILSFSSFMERMQQLESLEVQYQAICSVISSIHSSEIMTSNDEIEEVGDELIELYKSVKQNMESVLHQKKMLYRIAESKREVEIDLKRYLVWLKGSLTSDEEELKLCDNLEEKLGLLQIVHADAKSARDERRAKEAEEKARAEEEARKKAEEEELKLSLEKIQKDKDPKVGMVWNKQLREYQYLADVTEESWRD
eukprot:CAMPEP_0176483738 /NCGR_PEP_ID=MMETSP0200_2-20121128/4080_1 /TAXON_ID=947934 /ORGANISM="Chaetoceros sp., Strain GSL56" /LENGTH=478 /DNA_ID=CAMNT_0017880163 /DNA_START=112 /DNA_END=1548 /DNA_ORIENTATION=+